MANTESTKHLFVDDQNTLIMRIKPFNWIRLFHVTMEDSLTGGRKAIGLQNFDFEGN